ncbi:MAG: hypothetical protein KIT84_01910 [Labilithrix sp.]|nr:hypothetical protein [Labilithrix sp.]MCW5809743.1 hypothetical protein [Labilithrix sp.]
MRRVRGVVVVAVASTMACGLSIVGASPDAIDAGEDDAAAASLPDAPASPDAFDGDTAAPSVRDAEPDVRDAGADVRDAEPDVRDATGPTTFCTGSTATFCADFDDPADASVPAGWEPPALGLGASVLLVNAPPAHSSPRSLRAVSTMGNPAIVRKNVVVNTSLTVDFWVRFDGLPSAGGSVVSPFRITPPDPPGEDFFFFVSTQQSYFQEYGNIFEPRRGALTQNVWHHVVIKLTTTTSRIDARVDGVTYLSNVELPYAWPRPTTATIELGAALLYQTTSATVWIDDVVITAE